MGTLGDHHVVIFGLLGLLKGRLVLLVTGGGWGEKEGRGDEQVWETDTRPRAQGIVEVAENYCPGKGSGHSRGKKADRREAWRRPGSMVMHFSVGVPPLCSLICQQ